MNLSRNFFPALLAIVLLLAQLGCATHSLRHTLDEQSQQNKHLPQTSVCEQCSVYAQMGSALNNAGPSLLITDIADAALQSSEISFHSTQPLTSTARGPPGQFRRIA